MQKLIKGFLFVCFISLSGHAFAYAYGPTFENEHLYRIALRVRPNPNVTVQQMMVAILRVNPSAFVQNNINSLKAGYRLQLPSLSAIMSISPEKATHIVNHQ